MIITNQPQPPLPQRITLLLRHAINPPHMPPDREHRLPPTHRISAHDRMRGLKLLAHILRRTALFLINTEAPPLRSLDEARLLKRRSERLKEPLIRGRDAIIDFVAASPEGVAAALGELLEAQRGVVCGDGLEGDVGMPGGGVVLGFCGELPDVGVQSFVELGVDG